MSASIIRYEGASIVASDIRATLHFWVDFVGGQLVGEGSADGRVPWRVDVSGSAMEIYAATADQRPSPGATNQHYCWDIEPTDCDRWVERGKLWQMRPKSISAHHNGLELSLYWDDPDGYHFEFTAHYCTDHELRKVREARIGVFRQLMALPQGRFSLQSAPSASPSAGGNMAPIGLMNHFTMAAPDVESAMRFWIEFLGGDWYSESDRLDQVLLGGILVDLFPPVDDAAEPAPGGPTQRFRFAVPADSISDWVEKAQDWQVPTRLCEERELGRRTLVLEAPGGYHVGLEAPLDGQG